MAQKITTVCFVALAVIFTSLCCAAEQLPSGVVSTIKGACPEAPPERTVFAMGDLNRDRIPDVAIIISCKSPEDQELMILHGQQGGFYKIAFRSAVWPWNGRSEIELEIKNEVLVFSEHCAYNCIPEGWSSKYRFKRSDEQLILIGEDHEKSGLSGERQSGQSVNYLTRTAIHWNKGTGGYTEKKSRFKLKALLQLTEFNLDSCMIKDYCVPAVMLKPNP